MSRENIDFNALKERIKQVRKELGFSQELFGKRLGLKRQDIYAIETGKRQPGLTVVTRICTQYDISLNWLVLGIGEKTF